MKKTKEKDLKIIKGGFRRPSQKSNVPRMPRGLSPESKHWWKKIMRKIDKSILIPADCIALELLVDALSNYEKMKKNIEQKGETYETRDSKGRIKRYKRPEVEIFKMHEELVLSGLKEFFLTPASL